MKLTSTLYTASKPGNFGGNLHMFFTSRNPNDINAQGFWQRAVTDCLAATYKLGGDVVNISANIKVDQFPHQLQLDAPFFQVTLAAGGYGSLLTFNGIPVIVPGQALLAKQSGRLLHTENGVNYDFGFDFVFDWDGHFGHGAGAWWVKWS